MDESSAGCAGDATGDDVIDVSDVLLVLSHFGSTSAVAVALADLNNDGQVDVTDVLVLLSRFGTQCGGGEQLPAPDALVLSVRTSSGHGMYNAARMANGLPLYEDRAYTFAGLPGYLDGCPGIRTRNNDRHEPPVFHSEVGADEFDASEFLCFELATFATVYIFYDASVVEPPAWLTSRFVRLGDHTWQPSDTGSRCEDWLDTRWTWSPASSLTPDWDVSSERWRYPTPWSLSTSNRAVPRRSRCADLVDGSNGCAVGCNLHRAHGAPCYLDSLMEVSTRRCQGGGCDEGLAPTCECDGTCPVYIPSCAYDTFCDKACGFCAETTVEAPLSPGSVSEAAMRPNLEEKGTRRFDIYSAAVGAGETCLGDNGVSGAGANYVVFFGPDSPAEPFVGCDGVGGSGTFADQCGVCGGDDSCVGCDGVPNSGLLIDARGDCGGSNAVGNTDPEVQITFAGDSQLGRYVDQMLPHYVREPRDPYYDGVEDDSAVTTDVKSQGAYMRSRADVGSLTAQEQFERIWGDVLPLMRAADVMILQLETVATTSDVHWPNKRFAFDNDAGWRGSPSVRARPGRLSALSVSLCKSVFYGALVWARRALTA
jgi:hypothetical protein